MSLVSFGAHLGSGSEENRPYTTLVISWSSVSLSSEVRYQNGDKELLRPLQGLFDKRQDTELCNKPDLNPWLSPLSNWPVLF
ncbi:hypothetical protein VTN00DRAFT_6381 [Thermoascus crustaceus]|uniref:uncharacterized protein n=1 Tax=Thermoascus crustaceus TaxID=5088 RepID=UPI0037446FB7